MASQLNIWANQMDPIIPHSLRTSGWIELVHRAPQTTMIHDADVRAFTDEWVFVRLLPMLTPIAVFSDEGEEWRAMLDRRVLKMFRFKNHTLNKILSLLNREIPQYGQATRLAVREVYTLRRTWRGYDRVWVKDLNINETLAGMSQAAEHGWQPPTAQD